MKRMSWWIELGAVALTREGSGDRAGVVTCNGEAGREGGSGILILGDTGLEADQLEIGMEGAKAGAGGAREVTAASNSDWVAGGSPEGGGTKEAS